MAACKTIRFLIAAGGTREYIDPVRYISNASSGRMGCALAAAAIDKGHKATLITAPTDLPAPKDVKLVKTISAADMCAAVKKHFAGCDCLIMAAAVSDYTPAVKSKIKRKKSQEIFTLRLKPTADILAWAGRHKTHQFVVGFALEDKNLKKNAEQKLISKNANMIIANTPAAIGSAASKLFLKTPSSPWQSLPAAAKTRSAERIIRLICGHINRQQFD